MPILRLPQPRILARSTSAYRAMSRTRLLVNARQKRFSKGSAASTNSSTMRELPSGSRSLISNITNWSPMCATANALHEPVSDSAHAQLQDRGDRVHVVGLRPARRRNFGAPHYSAAKARVLGLARAMARDLGTTISASIPWPLSGLIQTDITQRPLQLCHRSHTRCKRGMLIHEGRNL